MRMHRNALEKGKFGWYNYYQLPERIGGGTATVRLHATDDDATRKVQQDCRARKLSQHRPGYSPGSGFLLIGVSA